MIFIPTDVFTCMFSEVRLRVSILVSHIQRKRGVGLEVVKEKIRAGIEMRSGRKGTCHKIERIEASQLFLFRR